MQQIETFGPPIPFSDKEGYVSYRDAYFEYVDGQLRVNPDVGVTNASLTIKSVRHFKKCIKKSKRDNAREIRKVRDQFADSKPSLQKSRRKGLLYGLFNIAVELGRQSHESEKDDALQILEARKRVYDEILHGCDHVIHEIEMLAASTD